MGITQHVSGTNNVLALANLSMAAGQIGKPFSGVNPLRGQNNVQGACDMGGLPNVYPGYQRVDDEKVRKKFEEAWGVPLSPKPGLTLMEMMQGVGDGKIKALFILGENPLLSDPNAGKVKEELKHLDLLVVAGYLPFRDRRAGPCRPAGGELCGEGRDVHQHASGGSSGFARPSTPLEIPARTGRSSAIYPPGWDIP